MPTATAAAHRLKSARSRGRGQLASQILLEFESPTAALIEAPVRPVARGVLWLIASAVVLSLMVLAFCPVNMVVTGAGRVVSAYPTNVVQPLETAIVRAINVREGQTVKAGDVLVRLDPTFSTADLNALQSQVKSYQAEVDRLSAEAAGTPFQPGNGNASAMVQYAIYNQRQAQYRYQIESYSQKIAAAQAQLSQSERDVKAFNERLSILSGLEAKRRDLERMQLGSQIARMNAEDQRIEMERNVSAAKGAADRARSDLRQLVAERDGFEQQWKAQINQELALRVRALSEATESLRKVQLRRDLVDLRAEQDAVVLTVAKISVGSVVQTGEPLITLVPSNGPLEVETRVRASEAGYVHPGQNVTIKFDTFPFVQYGTAEGVVRIVSPDSFHDGSDGLREGNTSGQDSTGAFYKVQVSIRDIKMQGVPGGFRLKPGMTVVSDIKAGERTLLTYLFSRLFAVGQEGMREP